MRLARLSSRQLVGTFGAAALGLLLAAMAPPHVAALAGPVPATAPPGPNDACPRATVDYALSAKLRLADTPMGQGDGTYAIGPGTTTLRFDTKSGSVTMLAYAMQERFTVVSKTLFWTTTVRTDTKTTTSGDARGAVADGALVGRQVRWSSDLRGYRTDGTLTCDGSLCGKFGAPPQGRSELHVGPHPVRFEPFVLAADGKSFTMREALVSKGDSPKQNGFLTLAGRETRRVCE